MDISSKHIYSFLYIQYYAYLFIFCLVLALVTQISYRTKLDMLWKTNLTDPRREINEIRRGEASHLNSYSDEPYNLDVWVHNILCPTL
jgi:hypothetical protein